MTDGAPADDDGRIDAGWLALREPADAAARSLDLVERLRARGLAAPLVIHDLGCGTGSQVRWLAPLLPGPQRWVLADRDPAQLERAAAAAPAVAADGSPVAVEVRCADVAEIAAADLAGAALVTASALLDLLSADEVAALAAAAAEAGCPVLLTLTVAGKVRLDPPDPADDAVMRAFNAHQVRGRLLGPGAVAAASEAFLRRGYEVLVRPSPWRLGPSGAALAAAWLDGWLAAACEQEPDVLSGDTGYVARRRAEAAAGALGVTLAHADILALPR